jgi:hypothetical protein
MLRGGSYINNARFCRSAYRNNNDARNLNNNVGLRVCVSASTPDRQSRRKGFPPSVQTGSPEGVPAMRATASENKAGPRGLVAKANVIAAHLFAKLSHTRNCKPIFITPPGFN